VVELVDILIKDQIEIYSTGNLGRIPREEGFSNEWRTTVSKMKIRVPLYDYSGLWGGPWIPRE
jgi:hypothetical protein